MKIWFSTCGHTKFLLHNRGCALSFNKCLFTFKWSVHCSCCAWCLVGNLCPCLSFQLILWLWLNILLWLNLWFHHAKELAWCERLSRLLFLWLLTRNCLKLKIECSMFSAPQSVNKQVVSSCRGMVPCFRGQEAPPCAKKKVSALLYKSCCA